MMDDQLTGRNLPNPLVMPNGEVLSDPLAWLDNRSAIKDMLCEHEYGRLPERPDHIAVEVISTDEGYCASKAVYKKIRLIITLNRSIFSFPIDYVVPKSDRKAKAVVLINFRGGIPDTYIPSEEICDNGFAVASFCYEDVTSDDGDFTNGVCRQWFPDGKRRGDAAGKIAAWAWAAMRVMDFLLMQEEIDPLNIAVAGHSRLGKTALLAAAMDERFSHAWANNSGCCGAALSRGKEGETIERIIKVFPHWFCPNFARYSGHAQDLPFDQHALLALIAPRHLYVASAEEDLWADPVSEFLSCAAASDVYRLFNLTGLKHNDAFPNPGTSLHDGSIGYHIRSGSHYLSRYDWNEFMKYMSRHAE